MRIRNLMFRRLETVRERMWIPGKMGGTVYGDA